MKPELPALPPEVLRASASRVALGAGQTLFFQGETVEYIYYVLRGEVQALRHLPDGTDAVCSVRKRESSLPSRPCW